MKEKKTCTVLIIDDSQEDREKMSQLLAQSKNCLYSILEAENAARGLELCQQVHIDCVLLDYELPDCNGLEFLDFLRNKHHDVKAPVVMITGHGSEQVVVQAMKAGAVDYLSKNALSSAALQQVTQNALERLVLANEQANEARQKQITEAKLKTNEDYFRALIDSVADCGLILLNEKGQVISWNSGARNLFNLHDFEIIGQSFQRLFVEGSDQAGSADVLLAQEAETNTTSKVQRMLRRGHRPFIASYTLSKLTRIDQQARGYSLFIREVEEPSASPRAQTVKALLEHQQKFTAETLETLRVLHNQLRDTVDFAARLTSPLGEKIARKIEPCFSHLRRLTSNAQAHLVTEIGQQAESTDGWVAIEK